MRVTGIYKSVPFARFLGTVQDTSADVALVYTLDADGNASLLDGIADAVEVLAASAEERPNVIAVGAVFTKSAMTNRWYLAATDAPASVRAQNRII